MVLKGRRGLCISQLQINCPQDYAAAYPCERQRCFSTSIVSLVDHPHAYLYGISYGVWYGARYACVVHVAGQDELQSMRVCEDGLSSKRARYCLGGKMSDKRLRVSLTGLDLKNPIIPHQGWELDSARPRICQIL